MLSQGNFNQATLNASTEAFIEVTNPYSDWMQILGFTVYFPAAVGPSQAWVQYESTNIVERNNQLRGLGYPDGVARDYPIFYRFAEGKRLRWAPTKPLRLYVLPTGSIAQNLLYFQVFMLPIRDTRPAAPTPQQTSPEL